MKTKRFTLRLDEETLAELQRLAELNNRTMSDVVRLLIMSVPVRRGKITEKDMDAVRALTRCPQTKGRVSP